MQQELIYTLCGAQPKVYQRWGPRIHLDISPNPSQTFTEVKNAEYTESAKVT